MWKEAERQLAGVGDPAAGEWRETGDVAVHLRRRLSEREQVQVGPEVDIRGSDEARMRAARLPGVMLGMIPADELGVT